MILAKHTAQIAPGEKYRAAPVETLDAGLLAAMRRDNIHFCGFGADQTHACFLEAVDSAAAGAEVAVRQMGIGAGAFLRRVDGGEQLVARDVVV